MFILYDLFFLILFIVYLPFLAFKQKLHAGYWQRLGFLPQDFEAQFQGRDHIWIHAVSVGELMSIKPVVLELQKKYPHQHIVITTVTQTGFEVAHKQFHHVTVLWAPLDFSWVIQRYIKAIKPKLYIIVETELWPNMLAMVKQYHIPMAVISGRISDKSFAAYQKMKWWMKSLLSAVNTFGMQSALDQQRIIQMGADANKVTVLGNIKYDLNIDETQLKTFAWRTDNEVVLLASSTHPGEEYAILRTFRDLQEAKPYLRLIIVPRHPERAQSVAHDVTSLGFHPVLLSSRPEQLGQKDVLIVDQIGVLMSFYKYADIVFMGKTLLARGGQNMIEPAYFSKPIIVGPHTENFRQIMHDFHQHKAILQIQDEHELKHAIEQCIDNKDFAQELGKRAFDVTQQQKGALQRTMKVLQDIIHD